MRKLALTLALPALLASATASAHFNLNMPPASTNNTGGGKGAPPCGPDTTEGTPMAVTGGTDLPLTFIETVRHGGFYRVALALTSCHVDKPNMPKCFPADNTVYDAGGKVLPITGPGDSDHADFEMPAKFPVLGDNLFPHPDPGQPAQPTWTGTVPIPNLTCDKCTLQVIEFMHPHGPNAGGGYFYHHCADLKITADPGKPMYDPNGMGGAGGAGGAATGGGGAGGAATGGGGAGGVTTGGTAAGGTGTAGTGNPIGGTPTTGGTSSTAGMTTTPTAGTGTGTAGTGTTTTAASDDSGGCGIAKRTQGGATALAALGLLFTLVRRRRAR